MSETSTDQFQPGEGSEYGLPIEAIECFDQAAQLYQEACEIYAKKPSFQGIIDLTERAGRYAHCFSLTLQVLSLDTPPAEFVEISGKMLFYESEKRVNFLNSRLGSSDLQNFSMPQITSGEWPKEDDAPEKSLVLANATNMFNITVEKDTTAFIDLVDKHRQARKAKLRGYAIDIGKMTLSAGIAIAVTNLRRRKR